MGKQEFDLVMSKVDEIAEAVTKFPESAHGAACTALVNALLLEGNEFPNGSAKDNGQQSHGATLPSGTTAKAEDRDFVAEIKADVEAFSLGDVNDKQFAAYTAYYYIVRAPDYMRVEAISKVQLEEAIAIAGRKPPKNFKDPLNNAKKGKTAYLESGQATGTVKLTALGRYHVEQELLRRDSE